MSTIIVLRRGIGSSIRSRPTTGRILTTPCNSHHQSSCCRQMGIGRMIDMGGMPSGNTADSSHIRTVNASKNSKLQAVAFDFEALTSFGKNSQVKNEDKSNSTTQKSTTIPASSSITPDVSRIQQVASLLNVKLGESDNASKEPKQQRTPAAPKLPNEDIRAKYAKKLQGGLAGIELAKHQVENALAKGDAPGHMAARQMAVLGQTGGGSNSNKWMAMSGTGILLSYLSHRSIQLALLPNPFLNDKNSENEDDQLQSMKNLQKQLKGVVIDCIVDPTKLSIPTNRTKDQAHQVLLEQQLLKDLQGTHPNAILVVSDKDPYLKAAKELGMLTCRLQAPNARRGNVSAHFNIPSLDQVQEVVNEINGISFNAVLNR